MARVRTKSCQHSDLSKPGQRQTNRCHHVTKRQIEKKSTLKERKKNLESKLRIHGGWSFLLALAITAFVIALYIGTHEYVAHGRCIHKPPTLLP